MASKNAPADAEIKACTSSVILPPFEAICGAHKDSTAVDSPEDTHLVSSAADTVMECLPHATVLHSENISQKMLETETAAAEQAIHARATATAATAASARRATGNHPEATGMPMMKGRLGANCPFRTAIALSERPKPRRTPTKAP